MDIYSLSRNFWDYAFENPEKIKPNHISVFFFAIEHCNRLGWKEKFGFPTTMVMDAIGVKSYTTYIKTLNELVEFGFIKMIEKSKNQYSSNIIAIPNNDKAIVKALDKAIIKHTSKQVESTSESNVSIDIPIYSNTSLPITKIQFSLFWDLYNKKQGSKSKCEKKWNKLSLSIQKKIIETIPDFKKSVSDIKFLPFPETYLNNERWNDEIEKPKQLSTQTRRNPNITMF